MICFTANKIFWIGDDMETLKDLKLKLTELEEKIKEVKKRLPAHSTKPTIMMELLELEDQYDEIEEKIKKGTF